MKRYVLHPLWLAIGLVVVIFLARLLMVPEDFGVHGDSFTYNFHRLSNEQEWVDFPVKYQGRDSCVECHKEKVRTQRRGPHKKIQCENCHGPSGPVGNHPDNEEYLPVNKERALCMRCHASLEYPNAARSELPAIHDRRHKRRRQCVECHNPHDPREDVK